MLHMRWTGLALWVVGLAGLGMFGYSLTQQTTIQRQMNNTMDQINQSIQSTGDVVAQTSAALQPLDGTTRALSSIESDEEKTTASLASMNAYLSTIGTTEKRIINDLGTQNQLTSLVSASLDAMQAISAQLLSTSQGSLAQAGTEASDVGRLNGMTDTSIAQLRELNNRLAALRTLP